MPVTEEAKKKAAELQAAGTAAFSGKNYAEALAAFRKACTFNPQLTQLYVRAHSRARSIVHGPCNSQIRIHATTRPLTNVCRCIGACAMANSTTGQRLRLMLKSACGTTRATTWRSSS